MPEKMLYEVVRKMDYLQLQQFSERIRKYIYDTVYNNNGHLASNFGVIELTLALYRVFDPTEDVIIWDTSHQSYTHKLLTGRWGDFATLRTFGGISGFTNIFESDTDRFGTGHAGTSVSAALGYAIGDNIKGRKRNVIAIVGDGALNCGMVLEALNQLKAQNANVKIILNNNDMSISPNVGALAGLFSRIRNKKGYYEMKNHVKNYLDDSDIGHDVEMMLKNIKDSVKHTVYKDQHVGFFENMGIKYYGPADGHNIKELESLLTIMKENNSEPTLLHIVTTKGKGFVKAEMDPTNFHGVSKENPKKGTSYSKIAGGTLAKLKDYQFVAFTAAMTNGTGLDLLKKADHKKVIDLGITEPTVVTAAAAVSLAGVLPVVAIYSSFMQRAFDSIIHDVSLQKIPSLFLLDRAGLVGEDGPTHHGVFDISFLRLIPDIDIYTPLNGNDLADMINTCIKNGVKKPTFIRFPRSDEENPLEYYTENLKIVDFNQSIIKKSDSGIYVLAVGTMINEVKKAVSDLEVNIIGIRNIKEIDQFTMSLLRENAEIIFTYEEGSLKGGFNEEIRNLTNARVISYGIKDSYVPQGTREQLFKLCSLDSESIRECVQNYCTNRKNH